MKSKLYFSNFIWRSLERFGANGISLFITIILARLLDPSIYGIVALISVFISILEIFLDSGLGTALIQKKDVGDLDFSTIFYFNVSFSVLLYVLLFFTAPLIDAFYGGIGITPVIRVMGLMLLIGSVKNIQQAYVARNMLFKKFFFATIGGTIGSAFVGIGLAYKGFGVWALVAQYLFNNFIDTLILWLTVKWRPKLLFDLKTLKDLLSFGWKLLVSNLIYKGYEDIRQLIIGRVYTPADLAFYNQGYKIPNLVNGNFDTSFTSILLPAISREQNDPQHVKNMLRRTNQLSQYVIGALRFGVIACAEPLISIVFTEKWLPAVPYLRLFCLGFSWGQMGNANMCVIVALGRSDIRLSIEITKTSIQLIFLIVTSFVSPMAIAIGVLISWHITAFVCTWPNKKLIEYSSLEQMKDLMPGMFIGILMCILVWSISLLGLSDGITLMIQIPTGAISYVVLSMMTKSESFYYILNLVKSYRRK